MNEIPPHSHVEIMDVPATPDACDVEIYGLNAGDEGEVEYLEVYGGASFRVDDNSAGRMLARLRRAFPDQIDKAARGFAIPNPWVTLIDEHGETRAHIHLSLKCKDAPETLVRDALAPFIDGFRRLERPTVHVFICHASEDKPAARELAAAMKNLGADVWFDEWEIRVGESIVEKINSALGTVSHLVVLLSRTSVQKAWVQRELSSALMRQLSNQAITVLPLLLDDCVIPPILADIKYADGRMSMERAVAQLEVALRD